MGLGIARVAPWRREARTVVAMLLTAALAASLVHVPSAAQASMGAAAALLPVVRTVALPLAEPRHVLGGGGEVYVTGDDELVVLDLDGRVIGGVEGLPDAGPLALDPDGEVLFVGVGSTGEVVAFDVGDLDELDAWELDGRPHALAVTDTHLYVGLDPRDGGDGGLVRIGLDGEMHALPSRRAMLVAVDDHGVVAASTGVSPGRMHRLDEGGLPLRWSTEVAAGVSHVRDLAADPDAGDDGQLWLAGASGWYPGHVLDPHTLELTRTVPLGAYPAAVTPLGDGVTALGRSTSTSTEFDVAVLDADDHTLARLALPGVLAWRGLSVTDDGTLVALARTSLAADGGWLSFVPDPSTPRPDPRAVTVTLDAVPPARAGEPLVVTGRVAEATGAGGVQGGAGVPSVSVEVEATSTGTTASHPTTTAADGTFEIAIPTATAGSVSVRARARESGSHLAASSTSQTATVRRWSSTFTELAGPSVAGHPETLRGRLIDEDGAARAGVPVQVRVEGRPPLTATTSTDGRFSVAYVHPSPETTTVRASVATDATHEAADGSAPLTVAADLAALAIDPATGTARRSVTLTGTVRDGLGRPVVARDVDVTVVDADAVEVLRQPVTDAQGRWTTTFTPRRGGSHTVRVRFAAGDAFAAATRSRTISIDRAATTVSLAALPTPVDHGTNLTLIGRVTTPAGASLDLVAVDLATGTERRVARAPVDGTGRLTATVTARANTRYEARFRGDATYAPVTAARTVRVRSVVTAAVSGHDRTVDGVPSFARSSRPTVSTRVRSATPQTRVTVTLQRWNGSLWVAHSEWRVTTGTDGRATTRTPTSLGAGSYRVKVTAPATTANLQGVTPWQRLRVR
jgi:5-hydroxyisourate hydrolase-like protein (transthyretin family)